MRIGKLSGPDLEKLVLSKTRSARPDVLLGALPGEDCCAVAGGDILVLSTDPITAAQDHTGFLAVQVSANDIAAAGASPFACLATLLLPETVEAVDISRIMDELAESASRLDIEIIGGHTEITDAVTRPVISLTMLGRPVVPGKIVTSGGLKPKDTLVMTKYAGIEGTLLLAARHETELREHLDESDHEQLDLLEGFMSVIPEGAIGARDPYVTAMHDVTEGGVLGAVHEMCSASGTGAVLDLGRIPILPVTRKICEFYRIDPLRLISSGSMLLGVEDRSRLMEDLAQAGIAATVIGHTTDDNGALSSSDGARLSGPGPDELYTAGRTGSA